MSIISQLVEKSLFSPRLSVLCVFLFLAASPALAEKWYFEPVVSMQLGYDDNVQLSTDNEIETSTSNITANAEFGFRTETSNISISAKMIDERFDDHSSLNSNDQYLKFNSSLLSGLNQFGVDVGYDRVSTRTSEFDYSGYSTSEGHRITKSVAPYWSRTLSERTSLSVNGAYSKVEYEDTGLYSSLNDYTDGSVNMSLQRRLSERSSLQTVVSKSQYKSSTTEYDTTSVQLGLDYIFDETLSFNMLLGPSYTTSKSDSTSGEKTDSVGKVIDFSFNKEFYLTTLSGALRSSESAGGEGKLTKNTSLSLVLRREISERTSFSLNTSVRKNESGGGITDNSRNRTYVYFTPKLSWKASPWWTISGSYGYKKSENTSSDEGPAESNAIYISMEYVWPREPH